MFFKDCTAPFIVDIFTDGQSDAGAGAMNAKHSRGKMLIISILKKHENLDYYAKYF